ncbi:ABC-2 transporter permease [Cohnella sp. JJ-181]|uniref:ABC-2 transporter permease n=1 Tax=Cohnella rhizoplanae TaxID=2974897 RepID=UPI0022FF9FFF|nr:ABC-2 transporter permease [Cohnella sp. JJ-181]CAI6077091.1 hypothetical protein COHCIP112018_02561 [Cohnella sp. JJ-181]
MYNLVKKDFKLGVHPMYLLMPVLTGALMLVPGWIYFLVLLYFCWITIPNMFGGFRAQNDLMFTTMLPVTKPDMVKARVTVIVSLELLHIALAVLFGIVNRFLYPNLEYYFFAPSIGFLGLCFAMLAIFNAIFIPMYYKTAYHFGRAAYTSIGFAMLFAGCAQWAGVQSPVLFDLFNGDGHLAQHILILIAGIALFAGCTLIAYRAAVKRFLQVEI